VVFCTSEKNLDLSRGVISKSISSAAGPKLQQDCRATAIDYGQIVKMPAYNLATAKHIYLGACCRWDGSKAGQSEHVSSSEIVQCEPSHRGHCKHRCGVFVFSAYLSNSTAFLCDWRIRFKLAFLTFKAFTPVIRHTSLTFCSVTRP